MKSSVLAFSVAAIVLIVVAISAVVWLRRPALRVNSIDPADMPVACRPFAFEGVAYVVCEIDTRAYDVGIFHADGSGKAFGSLEAFDADARRPHRPVLLAMNAGMYHEDMSPVGLLIQDGVVKKQAETADGEGNFFLKPNGVLAIQQDGSVSIMETGAYIAAGLTPKSATQSGPMLVIDGQLHPKFEENGTSRHIRNGAGVRDAHTLLLAISLEEVSLGSFARLFRDGLGCPDALFFDGVISAMSNGRKTVLGGKYPVGPIIAVRPRGG